MTRKFQWRAMLGEPASAQLSMGRAMAFKVEDRLAFHDVENHRFGQVRIGKIEDDIHHTRPFDLRGEHLGKETQDAAWRRVFD